MHPYRLLTSLLLTVLSLLVVCRGTVEAAEQRVFISIPALGVVDQGGKLVGTTHYLAVQIDRLPDLSGPRVQFNEGSRALGPFKGSALSPDWKDAARRAVDAAARALGEDPRSLLVTIKDVSNAYMTDGPSTSAALAVGIVAALRGDALRAAAGGKPPVDRFGSRDPARSLRKDHRTGLLIVNIVVVGFLRDDLLQAGLSFAKQRIALLPDAFRLLGDHPRGHAVVLQH